MIKKNVKTGICTFLSAATHYHTCETSLIIRQTPGITFFFDKISFYEISKSL